MKPADIIGAWRSAGRETIGPDGAVLRAVGPNPGSIMYTADGHVSVVSIMDPLRKGNSASPEEKAALLDRAVCYSGRFEINDDVILHHIEVSIDPNLVGTTQPRRAILTGNRLVLIPLNEGDGVSRRILWERATA